MTRVGNEVTVHVTLSETPRKETTEASTQTDAFRLEEFMGTIGKFIESASKTTTGWKDSIIQHLNTAERVLDEKIIPNNIFQKKLDNLGKLIEKKFEPLKGFNEWLDSNGERLDSNGKSKFVSQLATFLYKLPARSIRNILNLLYSIIREILCSAVHPTKIPLKVARLLTQLVHELTKPEVWSKMGIGVVGSSLGVALVTGSSVSTLSMWIGGAMVLAGLTVGPLKSALIAEKGQRLTKAKGNLSSQAIQLPEAMLTGFLMGLIVGGIQRAVQNYRADRYRVTDYQEAKQYADQFVKEHNLPDYHRVYLDEWGRIHIEWYNHNNLNQIYSSHPDFFPSGDYPSHLDIVLRRAHTGGGFFNSESITCDWWDYDHVSKQGPLNGVDGFNGRMYPTPPISELADPSVPLFGAVPSLEKRV